MSYILLGCACSEGSSVDMVLKWNRRFGAPAQICHVAMQTEIHHSQMQCTDTQMHSHMAKLGVALSDKDSQRIMFHVNGVIHAPAFLPCILQRTGCRFL